jgi:hypothetical protein
MDILIGGNCDMWVFKDDGVLRFSNIGVGKLFLTPIQNVEHETINFI